MRMGDAFKTEEGKQLIVVALLVSLAAGGGGGFVSNMVKDPRPDPFTGTQGEIHEQRIVALEREHMTFRQELDALPPDWFEDDFKEVKDELREVNKTSQKLQLELVKIGHLLSSLQMRGHISPNDLMSPGIFPGRSSNKE